MSGHVALMYQFMLVFKDNSVFKLHSQVFSFSCVKAGGLLKDGSLSSVKKL